VDYWDDEPDTDVPGERGPMERDLPAREGPWYRCARCGKLQPSYLVYETGWAPEFRRRWYSGPLHYWCLNHIPLRHRIKMWWRMRREP